MGRSFFIATEILKNIAMSLPAVRARRGSRSNYANLLDRLRLTRDFYESELRSASVDPAGKAVVELGPGSNLGGSLYMLARGAASAFAADKYQDLLPGPQLRELHQQLAAGWTERMRTAVADLLPHDALWFRAGNSRLQYAGNVPAEQLGAKFPHQFDLAFSFGVLGCVSDLDQTMRSLYASLRPGGFMLHWLNNGTPCYHDGDLGGCLNMYTFGPRIWRMMYSHRSGPNRLPYTAFERPARQAGFTDVHVRPALWFTDEAVERHRAVLAKPFRNWRTDQLGVHAAVLTARKK